MKKLIFYSSEKLKKALYKFKFNFLLGAKTDEDKKKENYYCGITDDLERSKRDHNVEKYATTQECDSDDDAKKLKNMLDEEGFDTGGQDGNEEENGVHVYMYRKILGVTKE